MSFGCGLDLHDLYLLSMKQAVIEPFLLLRVSVALYKVKGFRPRHKLYKLTCPVLQISVGSIGEIYKVRIAHDNTGDFPSWLCDEVRMRDRDTGEELVFPVRRWLSREEDDREICRELPANRRGEPSLPGEYSKWLNVSFCRFIILFFFLILSDYCFFKINSFKNSHGYHL